MDEEGFVKFMPPTWFTYSDETLAYVETQIAKATAAERGAQMERAVHGQKDKALREALEAWRTIEEGGVIRPFRAPDSAAQVAYSKLRELADRYLGAPS